MIKYFNKIYIFLFFIILLAFFLRLNNILLNSYWLDELFSIIFSHPNNSISEVFKLTLEDVHPPLYQFLLWLNFKLFGFSEFSGRFFSVLIGTLIIPVAYFLSKEFFDSKTSLVVSFIFAINSFLIYYSQETRSYQLYLLFSLFSFMFLYKFLVYKKRVYLFFYLLFTILWIYTHYYSFFLIATQFIFTLIYLVFFEIQRKQLIKNILFVSVILCLFTLPLLDYILLASSNNKFWWIEKPSVLYFFNYLINYFSNYDLYFILLGFLLSFYSIFTKQLDKKQQVILSFLFIWLIIGIIIPYVKSILSEPLVNIRYSMILISPIILITIFGLSKTTKKIQLLILILFIGLSTYQKIIFLDKPFRVKTQFRQSLEYISKYKKFPIYELIRINGHNGYNFNHLQTYSEMLKLNLLINDDTSFDKKSRNNDLPKCFWLITNTQKEQIKEKFNIIHKKEFYNTSIFFVSKKQIKQCKLN